MSGLRWSVFRDDHLVGRLVEPIWEDMFWHSYRVIGPRERPLDPRVDITSASFWCDIEALSYVNLVLGVRAPHAFPAIDPPRDGRVWMRGLYVVCDRCNRTL